MNHTNFSLDRTTQMTDPFAAGMKRGHTRLTPFFEKKTLGLENPSQYSPPVYRIGA
jgi:hypothetical protein